MRSRIEIGDQVFASDGGEEFGAVRGVASGKLVIYVENAGEFVVPAGAVVAVHSHKVILAIDALEPRLRDAIRHAHDNEAPGL